MNMNDEQIVIVFVNIPRELMREVHRYYMDERGTTIQEEYHYRGWAEYNELKSDLGRMYPETFRRVVECAAVRYGSLSADMK